MSSINKRYTEYVIDDIYNISDHIQLQGILNKRLGFSNWDYNIGQPVVVVIDEKKELYKDVLSCINDVNLTNQEICLFINKHIKKMDNVIVELINPISFDTTRKLLSDVIIVSSTSVTGEEFSMEYIVNEDLNIQNILDVDTIVDRLSKHRCIHYSFETYEQKEFTYIAHELYNFMLKLGIEFKNCSFTPVLYNNLNSKANLIDVVVYRLEDVIPVYANVGKDALCIDIKIHKKNSIFIKHYTFEELYSRFAIFSKIKQGVFEIDGMYLNNYSGIASTESILSYGLQELYYAAIHT